MDKKTSKKHIASSFTAEEAQEKALEFVRYLRNERRLPVESAWLFGSYAKGTQRAWSDIDVCIISRLFEKEDALSYLWQARRREDVVGMIEPVGFSPQDFKKSTPSPLVHEIRTTGRRIRV